MTPHLIADTEKIEELRKHFTLVEKDTVNWTETYIDNNTGNIWRYYRVDGYLQGGGYAIFGLQPLPDTKQLINLSLSSENDDEIFAACRTLVDNEQTQKMDFRADLIHALENISGRQRLERIIKLTELDSALNRREILGKTYKQINTDAEYFKSIADRANKLKQKTSTQQ